MRRILLLVSFTGVLTACATLPDVAVNYYLPQAETNVNVTQVVDCNDSKTHAFVVTSVASTTVYSSDLSRSQSFNLGKLDGSWSDSNLTVAFTDDGRLKSVNAVTTGQAEGFLKSAIALAGTLASFGGGQAPRSAQEAACKVIADQGKGKPISITYNYGIKHPVQPGRYPFLPTPDSDSISAQLRDKIPELNLYVRVGNSRSIPHPTAVNVQRDSVPLTLSETEIVPIEVLESSTPIWSQDILVPRAATYTLPVPKSALFGQQTFAVSLSDAGTVSSITYGKQTGWTGAANVAGAAATAMKPETDAEIADKIKAKGDILEQEMRLKKLVHCQANPADCS